MLPTALNVNEAGDSLPVRTSHQGSVRSLRPRVTITTKGESPWSVTLNFEEIKWTVFGSPTSLPETNGLVPHTIALSHPFSDDRVVTMYGSDSLDGLGY